MINFIVEEIQLQAISRKLKAERPKQIQNTAASFKPKAASRKTKAKSQKPNANTEYSCKLQASSRKLQAAS
jgi:hypothetical protein